MKTTTKMPKSVNPKSPSQWKPPKKNCQKKVSNCFSSLILIIGPKFHDFISSYGDFKDKWKQGMELGPNGIREEFMDKFSV
jgi:hypothetical protein